MKSVSTLCKKEIADWLSTPLSTLFLMTFLGLSHWLFFSSVFAIGETSLRPFFTWIPYLLIVFLPALTMESWSLEKKQNTLEFLKSLPLTHNQILAAKFLARVVLLILALALTLPLVFLMSHLGDLEMGAVFSSYLGSFLFGIFGISLGLWFSQKSNSSVLAYLFTFLSLLLLTILAHPFFTQNLPVTLIPYFENASLLKNFELFLMGLVSLKAVFFFLWATLFFVLLEMDFPNRFQIGLKAIFLILAFVFVNATPSSWHFDLTEDQEHTLSQNTVKILNRLEDRVVIKLYFSKDLPPLAQNLTQKLQDILQSLKAASPQTIVIQEQNVTTEIEQELARQKGIEPLMLTIKTQNSQKMQEFYMGMTLHYQDKMDTLAFVTKSENFEYRLALSLLKLTSQKLPTLGVWIAKEQLPESNAFLNILDQLTTVKNFSQTKTDWSSQNLNAMIVVNPKNMPPETSQQITKLLEQNIPVLIFLSNFHISKNLKQTAFQTGLEDFLNQNGIALTKGLVLDNDYNALANFQMGATSANLAYPFWIQVLNRNLNQTHPVTASIEELVLPWSQGLVFKNTKSAKILVQSSQESFLQEDNHLSVSPQYVSQMKTLPTVESKILAAEIQLKPHHGQLIVMSNTQFLKDDFLNPNFFSAAFSNMTFLANLVEHTTWGEELIAIRSRGKTKRPLTKLKPHEQNWLVTTMLGLQILLPLLVLGVFLFLKNRRHKKWLRAL